MITENTKSASSSRSRSHRGIFVAAVLLFLAVFAPTVSETAAKGPPLATIVVEANAYATPDYFDPVVAAFPADAEVELTGNAAPGFLGVLYDGQEVFVPAQHLSLGTRPGIDTAVVTENTPLRLAPMPDGEIELTVPEGETVILTGATVDGYDAASYDGTGGWIDRRWLR